MDAEDWEPWTGRLPRRRDGDGDASGDSGISILRRSSVVLWAIRHTELGSISSFIFLHTRIEKLEMY